MCSKNSIYKIMKYLISGLIILTILIICTHKKTILAEFPKEGITVLYSEYCGFYANVSLSDNEGNMLVSESVKSIDPDLIIVSLSDSNIIVLSGYEDWVWNKKDKGYKISR